MVSIKFNLKIGGLKYAYPTGTTEELKRRKSKASSPAQSVNQKSIKGRVMAKQLADFPNDEPQGPEPQFPDEGIFTLEGDNRWKLFFDGAANKRGNGIGMLLVDPKDEHTPIAIKLNFEVTNNVAEYEACAAGLEAALERNVQKLKVYWDSALIINQVSNKWKTINPSLQKYHACMEDFITQFKEVTFH